MKLLKTLALAIVLALIPTTAAIAAPSTVSARYGTGSFTAGTAQLLSAGCIVHPYVANLSLGYETTDWYLDVRITGPNGALYDTGTASEYGTVGGTRTLNGHLTFCSPGALPGVYSITGVLNTYEGYYDYTPTPQNLTPLQFTVLPYVAPTPPPPPVPVVTYADVKGTVTKRFVDRGVAFTFKARKIPVGSVVRNKLQWSVIVDDRVRNFTQSPDSKRTKTYKFPARSGVHSVKVLRNGKVAMKVTVRS